MKGQIWLRQSKCRPLQKVSEVGEFEIGMKRRVSFEVRLTRSVTL